MCLLTVFLVTHKKLLEQKYVYYERDMVHLTIAEHFCFKNNKEQNKITNGHETSFLTTVVVRAFQVFYCAKCKSYTGLF